MTGRQLLQLICDASVLAQPPPGARVAVQHGREQLCLGRTLREQGNLDGSHLGMVYTVPPIYGHLF